MKQFAIGIVFILSLSSCLSIKQVEFKKAESIVSTKTGNDFEMAFDLSMYNPNNWSLRLTKVETEVSVDNLVLGNANLSQAVRLTRNSDFRLPMVAKSTTMNFSKFAAIGLNFLLGNQTATATIKGNMTLKKFIFRKKFQFEYKEKIDARFLESLF